MKKKTITVAVSGGFDPIHAGHIRYIREAAKLGDELIVILNGDDFLMRKKGFVFFPFGERKEIIKGIKEVNKVIAAVDEDQTVCKTLELIKPDIFAKGGDELQTIPEKETCSKIGCKLVTNVGGEKILLDALMIRKSVVFEQIKHLRLNCPYCDDHPILRDKCLYCKQTGKINVGKSG